MWFTFYVHYGTCTQQNMYTKKYDTVSHCGRYFACSNSLKQI